MCSLNNINMTKKRKKGVAPASRITIQSSDARMEMKLTLIIEHCK